MKSICNECNEEFSYTPSKSTGKFCSNDCFQIMNRKQKRQLFLEGKMVDRSNIRKHLIDIHGNRCSCCGITEWNNKPITLQVDHKDGNASNNHPENLRLLCPNCHSQTSTWGAKNKGNGRKSRGLSLY